MLFKRKFVSLVSVLLLAIGCEVDTENGGDYKIEPFVDLQGANLQGADLQKADLQGANLQGAHLRKADLNEANLQGADLQGAHLQEADLQEANLQGALYDDTTIFPKGFDPAKAGMVEK